MAYLLWAESVVVSLMAVVLVTAVAARLVSRAARILLLVLVLLVPPAFYIALAILISKDHGGEMNNIMALLRASMLIVPFLVGAFIVCARGMSRPGGVARSANWRRGRLAIALLVAGGLHLMTIVLADLSIRNQAAGLRARACELASYVVPPPVADRDNAALDYRRASALLGSAENLPEAWRRQWTAGRDICTRDLRTKPPLLLTYTINKEMATDMLLCGGDANNDLLSSSVAGHLRMYKWLEKLDESDQSRLQNSSIEECSWMLLTARQPPEVAPLDANDPQLREFLRDKAEAIRMLRSGAGKSGCRFEYNYQDPTDANMIVANGQWIERLQMLLCISARVRAAEADADGAVDDINAMLALAEKAGSCPMMINVLVGMNCDYLALKTIRDLASDGRLNSASLARIHLVDGATWQGRLQPAMVMDEAFSLAVLAGLADGKITLADIGGRVGIDVGETMGYRLLNLTGDIAAVDRGFAELRSLQSKPYWQAKAACKKMGKDYNPFPSPLFRHPVEPIVRSVVTPQIGQPLALATVADARRAVVAAAVAACRYRIAHGQWPDKLADLVPEYLGATPLDPFDGKSLRFKSGDNEIVIYSIGPDAIDNSGAGFNYADGTGDFTFTLRK